MASAPVRRSHRRPFGVRLYLTIAFAAIALVTAGLVYVLVNDSSEDAAGEQAVEISVGRTVRLADRVSELAPRATVRQLEDIGDPGYSAWVVDARGRLETPAAVRGINLSDVPGQGRSLRAALRGSRPVDQLPGGVTVVATPLFRDGVVHGALLARAERPQQLQAALEEVRGDRLTAAVAALGIAILVGFMIASVIASRIKRLATSAGRIAEGRLDEPLEGAGGRDEITALGAALETMRLALRDTFDALSSERDRLSAIFDALSDAVMVVGADGEVRFSNPAAEALIDDDRRAPARLMPWLRRAAARGAAEHDGLRVGDRVYALGARKLAAEGAVLAVVRDRTDELRRELAEREFVSNAAHELRNPIAGLSGAIEVLRSGAKDDPEARDHFLARLSDDADRVSRLTESLLTLARMEAIGEGGAAVLDVPIAIEEAAQAVAAPDGVDVEIECPTDLAASGDPVLLRQVLIGLLTNAFKNTPAPGAVTLRACRAGEGQVLIEVADTGTGIAAEELDRVFERFYRGSGSLEQEGFGLGLSIARRMVDVMGGEIGADSEPGRGSTFWIRLPLAKPAPTPVA